MMLLNIFFALALSEPKFTMSPVPGETVRAEVFFGLSGTVNERAALLLKTETVDFGTVNHNTTSLSFATARGDEGARQIVIFPPADRDLHGRACLITPTGQQSIDNSPRALAWCETFLNTPVEVVAQQPSR